MGVLDVVFLAATATALVLRYGRPAALRAGRVWPEVPLLFAALAVALGTYVFDFMNGRHLVWAFANVPLGVQIALYIAMVMGWNDLLRSPALLTREDLFRWATWSVFGIGLTFVLRARASGDATQSVVGIALALAGVNLIFLNRARTDSAYVVGTITLGLIAVAFYVSDALVRYGKLTLDTVRMSFQQSPVLVTYVVSVMAIGGARRGALSPDEVRAYGTLVGALLVITLFFRNPGLDEVLASVRDALGLLEMVGYAAAAIVILRRLASRSFMRDSRSRSSAGSD